MAARAGSAEALVFRDGIGDLGKIEDLMPILGIRIDHDLATAGAAGIRKMTLDLIDLRFRDDLAGISDMARLGAALLVGGFVATFLLGRPR
jgi:hypothetical protein